MFKFLFTNKKKRLLAIETSCDDTAMCLVEWNKNQNNFKILNNLNYSQIEIHRQYGGVYPHMAKMEHFKNLPIILLAILEIDLNSETIEKIKNNLKIQNHKDLELFFKNLNKTLPEEKFLEFKNKIKKIDYIAVTSGPGLAPALWTGIEFAKVISKYQKAKIYNINHMEGHIFSSLIKNIKDDNSEEQKDFRKIEIIDNALALLLSGGHTEIIYCTNKDIDKKYNDFSYIKIGQTLDDALGECYDKTARILNMPYPGGPEISKLSQKAREQNLSLCNISLDLQENIKLPRPMLHSKDYNFSFSGLKTSVINKTNKHKDFIFKNHNDANIGDNLKIFCREFEDSVAEIIIKKITKATQEYKTNNILVGGGVSANINIKNNLIELSKNMNIKLLTPDKGLSMDNALMIAAVAINKINTNKKPISKTKIKAVSRWSIENI